jgi:mRNA interferase MazF
MPISERPAFPRQWDVVVLPFPYADRLAEKRRPAVVVSKPAMAKRHGILWVAMITSAANAGWDCDIAVTNNRETGLTAPSVIRPWKLATVDISRVVRVAGRISRAEAVKLSRTLTEAISS